jgi:hypothetical protein
VNLECNADENLLILINNNVPLKEIIMEEKYITYFIRNLGREIYKFTAN